MEASAPFEGGVGDGGGAEAVLSEPEDSESESSLEDLADPRTWDQRGPKVWDRVRSERRQSLLDQ
eukprot:8307253-Alexandrium_andersonii.AAC.1